MALNTYNGFPIKTWIDIIMFFVYFANAFLTGYTEFLGFGDFYFAKIMFVLSKEVYLTA
jgi:hypothetical protein